VILSIIYMPTKDDGPAYSISPLLSFLLRGEVQSLGTKRAETLLQTEGRGVVAN
jgi:hypothetical protein